ncbi:MAG: hypothetical protein IPO78_16555 [Saprospiraceae bacterium]|nr:hypothetical protein [Saprospiraceae bacterium]MBK9723193.1 hypothetical protein [Saprospiraceae bacterium]
MFKICSILVFCIAFSSCSDDNTSIEEKPFTSFINNSGVAIDTIKKATEVWEYGFRFKPLANGTITKLGLKVPVIGSFNVKLYKLSNNQLLAQTSINSTSEVGEFFGDITDLKVNAGDDLGLAIVADVFFKVRNLSGETFMFPITKDNISIQSFHEEICGPNGCNAFPSNTNSQVIAPCVNLIFVKE